MYWVPLTKTNGETIYLNLDRFDVITVGGDKTLIISTLSQTEEDVVTVEVTEKPEDFVPLMES